MYDIVSKERGGILLGGTSGRLFNLQIRKVHRRCAAVSKLTHKARQRVVHGPEVEIDSIYTLGRL